MVTIKTVKKQKLKESKGITLIALVITIIVLLILAGVAIATLTGDNGILTKANDAKTKTVEADEKEAVVIAYNGAKAETKGEKVTADNLKEQLVNKNGRTDVESVTGDDVITVKFKSGRSYNVEENGTISKKQSVEEAKKKETVFDHTTTLEDTYGNQVTVPKGFRIASDSATEVTGGIVIEDATYTNTIGSQFVWIPVGTGEKAIKEANNETVEIELGRYSFTQNSDGTITTNTYSGSYKEDTVSSHDSSYGNAIAKDIEKFKTSANSNHGYYMGRYEAGVVDYNSSASTDNINKETSWTGDIGDNIKLVCKKEQQVWNYVTQNKASELSGNMYESEAKVTSDLINSYAWDTAIVFIQKCGTESNSSTYSKTVGISSISTSAPQTTGTNTLNATNKEDKQCNIFDMSGNCYEWTTETCSNSIFPCVRRGGYYDYSDNYTSYRYNDSTSIANSYSSFRPLLYL